MNGSFFDNFLCFLILEMASFEVEIEDITWPHGDTNFIFECRNYLSQVSADIKDNFLNSFSKQQKVVIYCKMPVTEML